ncbi:protein disulfide oxidoreductase [Kingella oralis]|uniref:protein disulfide oxidoreductase n=1 Tax=Kingella oralis TaxID=505 RepID=UPI002D80CA83|nr:protein disulfide oxidoreductase [Kingella oralis]
MRKKIITWAKQATQMLLLLLAISLAVDALRAPKLPIQAAQTALPIVPRSPDAAPLTTTLQAASQNQTLLLYIWGAWCGICKHTSPVIQRLHDDGTPVLSVALRSGSDDDIRAYLQQQGYTFPAVNDDNGAWSQQWGVKVTPTIVLIKNGKVLHSTTGLASYWTLKTRIALVNALH